MPTPSQIAPRDGNSVPARMAVLNTDTEQGQNLVAIEVSADGLLQVTTSATKSFTMVPIDPKDQNYVNVWCFQGLDGLVYPAVADASGALLVEEM